jgi:toxin ParE1/3/4
MNASIMHNKLLFLRDAENDAREIESYIADDDPMAARRFRAAFEETAMLLLHMPHIGSMRVSDKPVLKDIRVVPVKDFDRYCIFYRPIIKGIEIVRVLHGARDYTSFF